MSIQTNKIMYRALKHPVAEMILALIPRGFNQCTKLFIKMRLEQAIVSSHLKKLRDAGIVGTVRHGKEITYTINDQEYREIYKELRNLDLDSHGAFMVYRALANEERIKIFKYIQKNKDTDVFSIYNTLDLEQSVASQHLRIMREAKVLFFKRDLKNKRILRYRINTDLYAKLKEGTKGFDL